MREAYAQAMSKPITPGRLIKWAGLVLFAWIVVGLLAMVTDQHGAWTNVVAGVVWLVIGALAVMAGVAKAVQIGVRTSRD